MSYNLFVYDSSVCLYLLVVTTLNKEIDSDSGDVPKHLGEIADSVAEWEGKLLKSLGLQMLMLQLSNVNGHQTIGCKGKFCCLYMCPSGLELTCLWLGSQP